MALSYTNLFTDLGVLVKQYNDFATTAQAIPAAIDTIEDAFASDHQEGAIDGLRLGKEDAWQAEYAGRRAVLASYATNRLTDVPSVVDELGVTTAGISPVLFRLIEQMIVDSQTVNASAPSIGSTTTNAANVGNGTVLTTALLDSVTSPGSRQGVQFPSHYLYGGLASQLVIPETLTIRCTGDSFTDQLTEGSEAFSWIGGYADSTHGVQTSEGSGSVGSITAIHGSTSRWLANADFELFSVANTPDSWTIDAGTVATNIFSASGSNAYHGLAGLKLHGDGSTASIQISQAFPATKITAGKMYCFTCRIKADASVSAGDLTVDFEGTGYTAGATEKISVAHGSLPTSWTLKSFFVQMPFTIPSDFKLVIKWNGTPTNNKNLYIDDCGFGEVTYGAGLGVVVVRGAAAFIRNDRFTIAITNTEGVFQKFFRRVFGVQLPSDGAGGETILDSLAT